MTEPELIDLIITGFFLGFSAYFGYLIAALITAKIEGMISR